MPLLRTGRTRTLTIAAFAALAALSPAGASAQVPPSASERAAYTGLHAAAARGDVNAIAKLVGRGAALNARDAHGRTPLMVAAYGRHHAAARALIAAGADVNALEKARYDVVTIAAVANDPGMLKIALEAGANAKAVTSPYEGTALIAAAHLGHVEIVRLLIAAKAPLDHVNNLGWTALIEAIVLGDGGSNHTTVVKLLVEAGANVDIADRKGDRPLALAKSRKYARIVAILTRAGARP